MQQREELTEAKIKDVFNRELKIFEEKIKQMSFNYTKNLDDVKSDYLKRYLETRVDCLQLSITDIPNKLIGLQNQVTTLYESLGEEVKD